MTPDEQLICTRCGAEIESMMDVGYLGPRDRGDRSCHPFMEFETVCRECEDKGAEGTSGKSGDGVGKSAPEGV